MYKVYDRFKSFVMRLSFPQEPFLPWLSTRNPKSQYPTDSVEPWCLSHWPGVSVLMIL